MGANDLELACRKFAESQARESAPGTLLNLGDCEERRGHVVLARESFEKSIAAFQPSDSRLPYAHERFARADKRVARLTVRVRGSLPDGARLSIDGAAAGVGIAGPALLDRGVHVIVLSVSGHPDVTERVELAEGESRTLELSTGEGGRTGSVDVETKSQAAGGQLGGLSKRESAPSPLVRPLMWSSFGLAAAGILVGAYGGLRTIDAQSTVDDNCKPGCNPTGLDAQDDGRTWSTVSTVGFIVGGVALAGAVGLLVFGKSARPRAQAHFVPRERPAALPSALIVF
ncbi:MAG: hypothetical protein K0S65_5810 [Labilithrix sp.]|nr:hypothetical protein [Labilithrix sp.]